MAPFSLFLVAAPLKWSSQKRVPFFSRVTEQLSCGSQSSLGLTFVQQLRGKKSCEPWRMWHDLDICRVKCGKDVLEFEDIGHRFGKFISRFHQAEARPTQDMVDPPFRVWNLCAASLNTSQMRCAVSGLPRWEETQCPIFGQLG